MKILCLVRCHGVCDACSLGLRGMSWGFAGVCTMGNLKHLGNRQENQEGKIRGKIERKVVGKVAVKHSARSPLLTAVSRTLGPFKSRSFNKQIPGVNIKVE
jgi:hypothetical protein